METARQHDINGWYEIKKNPISKAGVFEYLGSTINAPEPDRIYRVYRPPEELADPACVESFKLVPWVVNHEMLGEGETPAEEKGIEGVVGQEVFFDQDDGYLKGNIKVFSDHLSGLIDSGMEELSLGYKCVYEFKPGSVNGEHFDAIQRKIRGNHLALVDEGRMGKEVSVLDKAIITFDAGEFQMSRTKTAAKKTAASKTDAKKTDVKKTEPETKTADGMENMDMEGEMTLESMSMMISKLMPLMEEVEKLKMMINGGEEKPEMMEGEYENNDMEMKENDMEMKEEDMGNHDMEHDGMMKEEDKEEDYSGMDGMEKTLNAIRKDINALKKTSTKTLDQKDIVKTISERDTLAARLSQYVGTFDHSYMTPDDVARYGVEKLSIPCHQGGELAALDAYLHNRQPPQFVTHSAYATDSKENFLETLFEGE